MTRRDLRWALCLSAGLGLVALAPHPAHAFSEAEKFRAPVLEGGGGGRWFTGSMKDGYSCAVCHTGGETPVVEIDGVPSSYVPGETYDIELVLPDDGETSSAVVELAGMEGSTIGTMGMPVSVGIDEECEVDGERVPAGQHLEIPGSRAVVVMDACGARRLRFSWTAPAEPRGTVWFHAAVVAGDASSDPTGDGVRTYAKVIPLQGGSAVSAEVGSACSTTGEETGGWQALLGALGAIAIARRRRRSK